MHIKLIVILICLIGFVSSELQYNIRACDMSLNKTSSCSTPKHCYGYEHCLKTVCRELKLKYDGILFEQPKSENTSLILVKGKNTLFSLQPCYLRNHDLNCNSYLTLCKGICFNEINKMFFTVPFPAAVFFVPLQFPITEC